MKLQTKNVLNLLAVKIQIHGCLKVTRLRSWLLHDWAWPLQPRLRPLYIPRRTGCPHLCPWTSSWRSSPIRFKLSTACLAELSLWHLSVFALPLRCGPLLSSWSGNILGTESESYLWDNEVNLATKNVHTLKIGNMFCPDIKRSQ